jgi:flagellar M-ring protein FliF
VDLLNFLRELQAGIVQAWKKLSLSARTNIVLAVVATVTLILFVIVTAGRTQYVPFDSKLDPKQINQVTTVLDENKVKYKLSRDNTTISVPSQDRGRVRLLLAQQDIDLGPRVLPGFEELFAENDFMSNRWLQDVKFMRAIRGDLQRQLNELDFVEYSNVVIREAEDELFKSEQKSSEAAVTLKLTRSLKPNQIKGIVNIISSAGGPNLHPDNITLMSTDLEVLHSPPESEFAAVANSKLEFKDAVESHAETRIMKGLRDMGVQGSVVVSARMDFDKKEILDKSVTEGAPVSEFEQTVEVTSTESLPEGAPGAIQNLPEGTAGPGGTNTSETTSEIITNYENSVTQTTTTTEPGNVVKYEVTLIVDGEYAPDTVDAEGNTVSGAYVGLDQADTAKFTALAKAAVGDGQEDAVITVLDHPFRAGQLMAQADMGIESTVQQTARRNQVIWNVLQGIFILMGFLLVRYFLNRAIVVQTDEVEEEEVAEIPAATREDMRRQEVANEIAQLAQQEPEMVAALLRSWMSEEEE